MSGGDGEDLHWRPLPDQGDDTGVGSVGARYPRTVLATCCLPWHEDGTLDEPMFRRGIRWLLEAGLRDLYVFGTAGEGHAVGDATYRSVVEVFCEELAAAGATPMIGVISLSVQTIAERIAYAADRGVRVFQISLPSWGPLTDRELRSFFRVTCGAFPELEFLHYNLARSGRVVQPREYAELAAEHPNLVATKYGAGDPEVIAGLHTHAPQLRHFLTEPGFFAGCSTGPCGLLASISSSNPARALAYFRAGADSDQATLVALHRELAGMMTAIRDVVGPARLTDGAYDKVVAKLVHPDFPLTLLPPYQAAGDGAYRAYLGVLRARFPAWLPPAV
jgi:dihydrodipicolinate synthase/N-acetylneuraminate lyase